MSFSFLARREAEADLHRVTQQPFKSPYYVALLLQLSIKSEAAAEIKEEEDVEAQIGEKRRAEDEGEADFGREVLGNLNVAFRTWVEGRQWLNVRQCVRVQPHCSKNENLTSGSCNSSRYSFLLVSSQASRYWNCTSRSCWSFQNWEVAEIEPSESSGL